MFKFPVGGLIRPRDWCYSHADARWLAECLAAWAACWLGVPVGNNEKSYAVI